MAIDSQFPVAYADGRGAIYEIYLAATTIAITGATVTAKGANPKWPHGHKYLRHITGRDSTGAVRRTLTIADPALPLFANPGAIAWTDKEGNTISREGLFFGAEPSRK